MAPSAQSPGRGAPRAYSYKYSVELRLRSTVHPVKLWRDCPYGTRYAKWLPKDFFSEAKIFLLVFDGVKPIGRRTAQA